MPRTWPLAILNHLKKPHQTTALCWRIEPLGKAVEGYTTHDRDVVVAGVTYRARPNVAPTQIPCSIGLNVDAVDVKTLAPRRRINAIPPALPLWGVTSEKLAREHYVDAWCELFVINWRDATHSKDSVLTSGKLGGATEQRGGITFELLPLAEILNQSMGRDICATCPFARFGRGHCRNEWGLSDGPDIATRTSSGMVSVATSKTLLTLSGITRPNGWANNGILRFTNGLNAGLEREVKQWLASGVVTLSLSLPFYAQVGDTVELEEGCARTWEACQAKGNSKNFGGHPFVPGQEKFQTKREDDD